ncbi:CRISPR-associated ring nuclease Csm6 [Candidatus Acidulodesulfobacterium sp. H_13]|uniref:CRISPR-associated ring nuclease Csm6 n=1 Tax=Candidatus Acidulodesulfobacterium sp. H_13 TaxID=3395470 RepID=UPI003AF90CBF
MNNKSSKEIFIFGVGVTPQIVTEGIYSLSKKDPPVFYDEIFIITTKVGKNILTEKLIKNNIFREMCMDIGGRSTAFLLDEKCIIVPKYDNGEELADITTTADNQIMANFITSFIKGKTVNSASRLHTFLSGGRKTMSFYMGLAMELYARSWDKTYHILISPEFESNSDFYYKPCKSKKIKSKDKILDTENCEINLIELPMFKLRNRIKMDFSDFESAVQYGQREIDTAIAHPNIMINLYDRTIRINLPESSDNISNSLWGMSINIKLSPMQLMIYATYLKIKLYNCKYSDRKYCIDCTECFPSLLDLSTKPALEEMAKIYKIISPSRVDILLYNYKGGLSMDMLRQSMSKIKKVIYDSLNDETLSSFCTISASNKNYGDTRHGIRIEKSKITIKPII